MKYDSIAERKMAVLIDSIGGERCDTFAPLLPETYRDANGEEYLGKPDFIIRRGGGYTFLETKSGSLNCHYTREDATEGLRKAYAECFGRCGDSLNHGELSTALYAHSLRGQILSRENSFHHSVFKLAAIQAKHGHQRYLAVFERNPTGKDAERYSKAGLVFCTVNSLPDFMQTIELMRYGICIPLVHRAKNYQITITPEMSSKGMAAADIEFIDRGRFLQAVAKDKAKVAAQQAKDDADWEAGIRPF